MENTLRRVLVMVHPESIRKLMVQYLERRECACIDILPQYGEALAALDAANESGDPYSLVLISFEQVRSATGIDIITWIRSREIYRRTHILFLTPGNIPDRAIHALTAQCEGASDFLFTPCTYTVFDRALVRL